MKISTSAWLTIVMIIGLIIYFIIVAYKEYQQEQKWEKKYGPRK